MDLVEMFFPPGDEYAVKNAAGRVRVAYSSPQSVPTAVLRMCENAPGLLRIAGSTTGLLRDEQIRLIRYASDIFNDGAIRPNSIIMSGGWRVCEDGRVAGTVLEVPQLAQFSNPACCTLGSVPLTSETMCFYGPFSTFAPTDQPGPSVRANPGNDMLWVVLSDEPLHPNDDIEPCFNLKDHMKAQGKATGLLVFGGGEAAAREIRIALEREHPVGLVRGFNGFAVDLIHIYDGHPELINPMSVHILEQWQEVGLKPSGFEVINSPMEGRDWLSRYGFRLS